MAAAAGLAITLVPVLMGYFIRGKVLPEHSNPLNRLMIALYRPILTAVLAIQNRSAVNTGCAGHGALASHKDRE